MIFRTRFNQIILVALGTFIFLPAFTAGAADNAPSGQDNQVQASAESAPLAIKEGANAFSYRIEGRPDPFLPFITERSTRNEDPNEIVEENKVLTGMQLFEPSQLTLVALIASESDKYAMVQDFTGKGYMIKIGTKIGRRGVVSEIMPNSVIIEETARTRSGETLTNKIAMVLKKEGEE
jgi:type IV pilus assembly protein PilP